MKECGQRNRVALHTASFRSSSVHKYILLIETKFVHLRYDVRTNKSNISY
jgi:hypothetical protein